MTQSADRLLVRQLGGWGKTQGLMTQRGRTRQALGLGRTYRTRGTPGITRILLYILYAKYLLCRVSQVWLVYFGFDVPVVEIV
jgi:hypothetical protein